MTGRGFNARSVHALSRITKSTQLGILPGSLNRFPASAVVKSGMSPLQGGR